MRPKSKRQEQQARWVYLWCGGLSAARQWIKGCQTLRVFMSMFPVSPRQWCSGGLRREGGRDRGRRRLRDSRVRSEVRQVERLHFRGVSSVTQRACAAPVPAQFLPSPHEVRARRRYKTVVLHLSRKYFYFKDRFQALNYWVARLWNFLLQCDTFKCALWFIDISPINVFTADEHWQQQTYGGWDILGGKY